jgi:hypothetical protein
MTNSVPPPPAFAGQAPPPVSNRSIDLVRALGFVFEDPNWIGKLLIGALFYIFSFLLIGLPFVLGYAARMMRNVIRGDAYPLPEWNDLGEFFVEGLKILFAGVLMLLPIILIVVMMIGTTAIGSAFEIPEEIAGCGVGVSLLVLIPLALVFMVYYPAALTRMVAEERFGAAFEAGAVFRFIGKNIGNYLLAIAVYLLTSFIAQFGILLLCIGVFLTTFWSYLSTSYALADTYRLARER